MRRISSRQYESTAHSAVNPIETGMPKENPGAAVKYTHARQTDARLKDIRNSVGANLAGTRNIIRSLHGSNKSHGNRRLSSITVNRPGYFGRRAAALPVVSVEVLPHLSAA